MKSFHQQRLVLSLVRGQWVWAGGCLLFCMGKVWKLVLQCGVCLRTSPLPGDFWLLKASVPSWVIEFLCTLPWPMYTCTYTQACTGRIWKPECSLKLFGICLGKVFLPIVDFPSGLSRSLCNYQLYTLLLSGQSLLLTVGLLILGAGSILVHLYGTKWYLLHFQFFLNGTLCVLE